MIVLGVRNIYTDARIAAGISTTYTIGKTRIAAAIMN